MKHLLLTAALVLPLSATAGGLVYEAPAEPVLAAAPMGDQNDWIIPLIALAAIVLLVQNSNDDSPPPQGCKQDCNPPPPPPDCITKQCVLVDIYGTDKWWSLPEADQQDVRDYWVESGRAEGVDDWSGFQAWLGGVTG